ncbi:hypothetical protein CLF_108523 [Clonorchis sinensis]|uniref:Uncharacterized protein n=1 Tax=Clonorchis sinensis TaxID=79923 RepID=G7YRN9_CLOSI|nr:hypothetical protein CLF_108523 [Clonorchis sinensis]
MATGFGLAIIRQAVDRSHPVNNVFGGVFRFGPQVVGFMEVEALLGQEAQPHQNGYAATTAVSAPAPGQQADEIANSKPDLNYDPDAGITFKPCFRLYGVLFEIDHTGQTKHSMSGSGPVNFVEGAGRELQSDFSEELTLQNAHDASHLVGYLECSCDQVIGTTREPFAEFRGAVTAVLLPRLNDRNETPCALNGPKNTLNACRSQFVTILWRIVTTITTLNDSSKVFMYAAVHGPKYGVAMTCFLVRSHHVRQTRSLSLLRKIDDRACRHSREGTSPATTTLQRIHPFRGHWRLNTRISSGPQKTLTMIQRFKNLGNVNLLDEIIPDVHATTDKRTVLSAEKRNTFNLPTPAVLKPVSANHHSTTITDASSTGIGRHIDQVEFSTRAQSVNGTSTVSNCNELFADGGIVSDKTLSVKKVLPAKNLKFPIREDMRDYDQDQH